MATWSCKSVVWYFVFCVGMCSAALPFILLGDAFDCVTLDVCEKAFSYVEKNVALWTSVCYLEHIEYMISDFILLMNIVAFSLLIWKELPSPDV